MNTKQKILKRFEEKFIDEVIEEFSKEVDGLQKGEWLDENGSFMVRQALNKVIQNQLKKNK